VDRQHHDRLGTAAGLTGLIHTATEFNIIRFLLGLGPKAAFPRRRGHLTHCSCYEEARKAIAMFMAAIPLSESDRGAGFGLLLRLDCSGWRSWSRLLILNGFPAPGRGDWHAVLFDGLARKTSHWARARRRRVDPGRARSRVALRRMPGRDTLSILKALRQACCAGSCPVGTFCSIPLLRAQLWLRKSDRTFTA